MKWFRMYSETLNDPKVQRLPAELFPYWINILCVASDHNGTLPGVSEIAFALRLSDSECIAQVINPLVQAGLIDRRTQGLKPHNWDGRQYRSDVSTDRVKRFRKRQRNVSETPSETPPDTDTDTEQIQNRADTEGEIFAYGEHKHAVMTAAEFAKLQAKLNSHCDAFIQRFDSWVHQAPDAKHQGVKRKDRNAYASICQWYAKDVAEGKIKARASPSMPSEDEMERERVAMFGGRKKVT